MADTEEIKDAEFTENAVQTLVPKPELPALAIQRAPEMVMEEARKAAKILKDVIDNKPDKVVIKKGEVYLEFEDWLLIARFYGVTAVPVTVEFIDCGDEGKGWKATANALLVAENKIISTAHALCLNSEVRWKGKPQHQVMSMAQTRACSKALANVFRWVPVLAGYKGTPAEELERGPEAKTFARPPKPKPVESVPTPVTQEPGTKKTSQKKPSTTWRYEFWKVAKINGKSDSEMKKFIDTLGYKSTHEIPDRLKDTCMQWAGAVPLPEMTA